MLSAVHFLAAPESMPYDWGIFRCEHRCRLAVLCPCLGHFTSSLRKLGWGFLSATACSHVAANEVGGVARLMQAQQG